MDDETLSELRRQAARARSLTLERAIEHDRDRIEQARALLDRAGSEAHLEVDGGINEDTAAQCAEAGADVFVAGSAVFGSPDPGAAYHEIEAATVT